MLLVMLGLGCGDSATETEEECHAQGALFEVGTTPAREPELIFERIIEGEPIKLEFGSQSSWMISFGVRTDADVPATAPAMLSAQLAYAESGELISTLSQKPTLETVDSIV